MRNLHGGGAALQEGLVGCETSWWDASKAARKNYRVG
jgi:hypothetical protein